METNYLRAQVVVRDFDDGQLKISEFSSGEGVELSWLDNYLERKHAKGMKLYASGLLPKVPDLLQDHTQDKQQGKSEQSNGADAQKLDEQSLEQLLEYFNRLVPSRRAKSDLFDWEEVSKRLPLLSEKTHPDHPLYIQALDKLEHLGPHAFANRRQLENAAGSLAFEAKVSDMQRIDVVIQSKDGTVLFALQGINDPAHQRIYADKAAAERSLEQSSSALHQDVQDRRRISRNNSARLLTRDSASASI